MGIVLFDPVCEVETVQQQPEQRLDNLKNRRIGYIFNQHVSALEFWKVLETEIEKKLMPSAVHRLYKVNTWASAPKADVEQLIRQTDYALIGVGA
jgi:hypothetical protein